MDGFFKKFNQKVNLGSPDIPIFKDGFKGKKIQKSETLSSANFVYRVLKLIPKLITMDMPYSK